MIYIFDKKQAIIKVLTNDDFTAAHLNFKINTATTFEFSLPASKALPSGSKYVATPHPLNDSKFIMLRLTERVDNTETIDYSAYELAYQELATDGYIEDKRPQNQSALNLMKIALDGSNWELNNVNVSGAATTNFYYVDRLSAISKVVDLLGGEIVFYIEIQGNAISGRYMDYLARQGADTSKVFASGSNLLTVERQSDTSGIYTAILPRGKGKEIDNGDADTPDGYGRRINIADVEWKKYAGKPLDKPKGSIVLSDPDATAEWGQINGNARLLLQTYDDIDDVNVLINSAYKTLQSVNHPQIQYSATVADVGGLSLGDTVLIMHGDRDLSYKTRVFEVKYDLLSPDQTELSLGDDLSSNSITSQINSLNAVADTTSSQTQWTINQIGRPGTTYGATAPDSPKVGDIWFKYLPDGGTEIYRWNGEIWELLASPTTADDIAAAVDDAVTQAKAHTDEVKQGLSSDIATAKSQATSLANAAITQANAHTATAIEQNNASQQEVMNDIANSQADLAIKDADFNNKAQAMADKALADAKSSAATVAQETLNSANDSIAQAKSDITDAYKNADGVISKKVDDTATSIGNTISQNKIDSDGKISTAQSTATQAINAVTTKVSQTVYDQKTGDLTTAVSKAQTTADGAVSTVGNYKTSNDGRVKAAESKIEQNSKDITARVSKTDYDNNNSQLNTRFTKVEATADGASTTVGKLQTAVNNLGQVNQLMNTEFNPDLEGWTIYGDSGTRLPYRSYWQSNIQATVIGFDTRNAPASTYVRFRQTVQLPSTPGSGHQISMSWYSYAGQVDNYNNLWVRFYDNSNTNVSEVYCNWADLKGNSPSGQNSWNAQNKWEGIDVPDTATYVVISVDAREGTSAYIGHPMLVFGSTVGAYVQGNYNNNAALAQVKITADGVSSIVSDPQKGLSVRVQTAEGTLNTVKSTADGAMSKASQTANDITQEISDRTTSDSNTLQSAKNFTQSTITSYDSGLQSQLTQTSSAFLATISSTNLVVDSSLLDSAATNTIVNWIPSGTSKWYYSPGVSYQGVQSMGYNQTANDDNYSFVDSQPWSNNSFSGTTLNASVDVYTPKIGTEQNSYFIIYLMEFDDNNLQIAQTSITGTLWSSSNIWVNYRKKITVDSRSKRFFIRYQMRGNGNVYVARPYVGVQELIAGGYTAGTNNNNQTILSLFKDNWSIGITDNIGAITSGIVGNSSSMSLISKNIVLDGNTTFTALKKTVGDTDSAVSQVKNTADSIYNFVRDSNGNLSSNFQTALSKTSIITGSTLSTSIQKQTATQITSALTDNNGKIISLINQDSSGVQIAGKNITLDGNTTVTGDFYAKGGNFKNLNASNMLIGTLNGDLINITNINASNIVSGSISGANLDINLNTGSVVFQKGRINSSDYTTDINIDQGYISTADGDTRALLTQGKLQLIDPTLFSPQKSPYLEISNYSGLFNGMSALVKARDSLTVSINGYDDRSYDTPATTEKFVGLNVRKRNDILSPTKIGGAEQGVIISGGHQFNMLGNGFSPYIYVGSDATGSYPNGDRVYISASYFHSLSTFARTTSSSANVVVSGDGALMRSSSSSKYKLDIEYEQQADTANRLLTLDPATWYDKFESEQLNKFHEIGVDPERTIDMSNHRYYGIIAEDLVKAGLEHIVSRNVETGEVEGVEYSKIGVALIPIIRDLRNRLNDQRVEIERLKEKIK